MNYRNWFLAMALGAAAPQMFPQSISSGTVTGTVLDPDKMVVPQASIELRNPVTGYNQAVITDITGAFRFSNVPENMYEIRITAPGFAPIREPVEVRSTVPINLSFTLKMAEVTTNVEVNASMALIDTDPSAHTDTGSSVLSTPLRVTLPKGSEPKPDYR